MDQREIFARPQVRRRPPLLLRGQQILFLFSVLVFILSLVSWGGIYFYGLNIEGLNNDLRNETSSLQQDLDLGLIKELVSISNKLASARVLIKNHTLSSSVFEFLEKNTHPKVSYASISYSAITHKISLAATAANYGVLARQIGVYESSPFIDEVTFGGLSLNDAGYVQFNLGLSFKPDLIKLR